MQQFSQQDLIKKGITTPFDQKIGKIIMGTLVVGLVMYGLWYFLPYIKSIFDNIESIASAALKTLIYIGIGGTLLIFARKQMRNLDYLSDHLARLAFNKIIEYDPFLIQEKQIHQAEVDVEKMMAEKAIIDGKHKELHDKILKYNTDFQVAGGTIEDLKLKIQRETDPKQIALDKLDIDSCYRRQLSCKKYIDSIAPIAADMNYMKEFISEGYQIIKRRIASAKQDLIINKDIFESAHAGAAALERMKRAMVGDIQLNSDAEKAQMAVMQNIALTVGQMKVSMEIIGNVTREANLEEGGQLALARKQLEALNIVNGDLLTVPTATASFEGMTTLKQAQVLNIGDAMPD